MIPRPIQVPALILSGLILVACADHPTAPESPDAHRLPGAELAAASNQWITRANLPSIERYGLTTAVVPNAAGQSVLYAIGGATTTGGSLSKVQAYNVATNTWSYKASLPRPLYWTNGAGVINGKIYVSGGIHRNNDFRAELYEYDPATDSWTEKRAMPTQGFRGVTGVINGRLYVVTDCDQENCEDFVPRALYRYDPATDQWTVLPAPPHSHGWGYGGVIGGKFYVTGGSSSLEVYDPATNTWSSKAPTPRRRWLGVGAALGGKLYVIGGFQDDPDGTTKIVRTNIVYDPDTDAWATRAPYPTPFINLAGSRVVFDGKPRIEVVGGAKPGNNRAYIP
jgi:N-acetylneuraminic acid mutarotase